MHHAPFMSTDDLKLFAKNYTEIESLLQSVNEFSSDIVMSFDLDKFAHLSLHWGKFVATDGITLPDRQLIKSVPMMIFISIWCYRVG